MAIYWYSMVITSAFVKKTILPHQSPRNVSKLPQYCYITQNDSKLPQYCFITQNDSQFPQYYFITQKESIINPVVSNTIVFYFAILTKKSRDCWKLPQYCFFYFCLRCLMVDHSMEVFSSRMSHVASLGRF